jgi:hypothetical protein
LKSALDLAGATTSPFGQNSKAMQPQSIQQAMHRPIQLRCIHAITAALFLASIIALAYSSNRLVGGSIAFSWIALGASFTPFLWSICLMLVPRQPRTLGWCSMLLSVGVVALGSKFAWPALSTLF